MGSLKEKLIGFDFGGRFLHAAVREGGEIREVITEPIPEGMIHEGRILSYEAMSDFLKEQKRAKGIRAKSAAIALPPSLCYCRRTTVPYMTEAQLRFNLPYEFREFITGDKNDYYYDYAVIEVIPDETGAPHEIEIVASAASKELIRSYEAMFRRAGFALKTVIPEEMAYVNLIRRGKNEKHAHCILDLGHTGIRLYIYNGDRYESVRALDTGCSDVTSAVADHFGIDVHMAETYLEENYEDSTSLPECESIYSDIAIEVLKAVNFYHFNNRDSELMHIHVCGGGARNAELAAALSSSLNIPICDMSEFWSGPDGSVIIGSDMAAAAAGAALQ